MSANWHDFLYTDYILKYAINIPINSLLIILYLILSCHWSHRNFKFFLISFNLKKWDSNLLNFRECFHYYDKFLHVYVDIQLQLDTVGTVGVSILYSFRYFKHLYHRRFHNPPCRNPHVAIFFINDHIITYQGTCLH